jgi:hypothetical protein
MNTRPLVILSLLLCSALAQALPFSITPQGNLPTTVPIGGTVTATYVVTNNTQSQRNNNYVKYLPSNVTQVTSGAGVCGAMFNLAPQGQPGDSCALTLTVAGPVDGANPLVHQHLFVCFPGGTSCAGTDYPLNVSTISTLTPHAYVVNSGSNSGSNGSVLLCPLNSDGSFGTSATPSQPCTVLPVSAGAGTLLNGAWNIAINSARTYAYISNTNDGGPAGINIAVCPILTDGTFGTCFNASPSFQNPAGLAFNTALNLLYVTTSSGASGPGNNNVYKCSINPANGDLIDPCSQEVTGIPNPLGIAVNNTHSAAFVSAIGQANTYTINPSTGQLSFSTQDSDPLINFTGGMALDPSSSMAYISNIGLSEILNCPVTGSTLGACNSTANPSWVEPAGMLLTASSIYISNIGPHFGGSNWGQVAFCGLNNDGSVNTVSCVYLQDPSFDSPSDVLIR